LPRRRTRLSALSYSLLGLVVPMASLNYRAGYADFHKKANRKPALAIIA
jgi:hypothetical protein